MMRPVWLTKPALALVLVFLLQACGFGERDDVLILVRDGDALSRAVGERYASARGIPDERILELPLSSEPRTPEIDVATFEREIAAPVEDYLASEDPDGEVAILVTTLGLPVRIGHCEPARPHYPRDCRSAAVDAALAGLGRFPPAEGPRAENANPFFGDPRSFAAFRSDEPGARLRFLVARITGPASASEAALSDDLVDLIEAADAASGPDDAQLWRILADAPPSARAAASAALFDPVVDVLAAHGHRVCDACRDAIGDDPPAGVVLQNGRHIARAPSLPKHLAHPGVVISLGGAAPPAFDAFVASWLGRGARAISTHIDDPSLGGVTRPGLFVWSWTQGGPAIEAHFKSVPILGWTNVFVGDPLLVLADATLDDDGDRDGDGVPDATDNCLDVSNPKQRDSNGDRVGNRCDPDVDDDGWVETSWGRIYPVDGRGDLETIALTARNGPYDPDHDLNGDGRVDGNDVTLAQLWLFRRPGPPFPEPSSD